MSDTPARRARGIGLLALALVTLPAMHASAQTLTVTTAGDTLRVRARGFGFIEGAVLERLRDGRSVRIDIELTVLARPGGPVLTRAQHGFNLSFDLWEQRFAASRIGTPPRSVSHLTAGNTESWCIDNVTVPVAALGPRGRETRFWVRLAYHVLDRTPPPDADDAGFPIWSLIDILSRRRPDDQPIRSMEAGPFRVTN